MDLMGKNLDLEKRGIRPLRAEDIPQVVDIHLRLVGPNSGRRFLECTLYPTMLNPASTGFGYVQVSDGKMVGFIVGTLNTLVWRRTLLRTSGLECIRAGLHMCLRGRKGIQQVVQTINYLFVRSIVGVEGHLFTLAIDENYQGRGLAIKLIGAFLDHCCSHEMSRCWVRTSKTNLAAYRIYKHMGFQVLPKLSRHDKVHMVYNFEREPLNDSREGDGSTRASIREKDCFLVKVLIL